MRSELTPLRFLARAREAHPDRLAVIDGQRRWTWSEFADEVIIIANALRAAGVGEGDRVAYLARNSAQMLAAHFAVPLIRGVLVAINWRLSQEEIGYICMHSRARLLMGEGELLADLVELSRDTSLDRVVELPAEDGSYRDVEGSERYDLLRERVTTSSIPWEIDDENRLIAINYTSGTTGRPKGVEYTHRGAYLNALGEVFHQGLNATSRYLWTLPMFHCNGWCTTWALTAAAGTHICLRAVRGDLMWNLIDTEHVTHLAGAPTVLSLLATAEARHRVEQPLRIVTAGAPPSPTIIASIRQLGAEVVHVYGLTETYGPYAVCEPQSSWLQLGDDGMAQRLARQGIGMLTSDPVRVVRAARSPQGELSDVLADGREIGEIVMRGNTVMARYHRDPDATAQAMEGGWFHSGDLGVMHPDGYVKVVDRAKDIIISGGENISSVEVEQVLLSHPNVSAAAVVGVPDPVWGEVPRAFVVLSPTNLGAAHVTEDHLIEHVRSRIAHFKAPRAVEFLPELPTTATGKTRKQELRARAREQSSI